MLVFAQLLLFRLRLMSLVQPVRGNLFLDLALVVEEVLLLGKYNSKGKAC